MPLLRIIRRIGKIFEKPICGLSDKQKAELGWWVNDYKPEANDRSWASKLVFEVASEALRLDHVSDWYAFLRGKHMLDLCCGPIPWEEDCQPSVLVCYDWLVNQYQRAKLLKRRPGRFYVNGPAEMLPFKGEAFDYIHFENALDHVDAPERCIREAWRVLRPGGYLYLGVDLGGTPTVPEPHVFELEDLDKLFMKFDLVGQAIGLAPEKGAYNPQEKESCVRRLYRKSGAS